MSTPQPYQRPQLSDEQMAQLRASIAPYERRSRQELLFALTVLAAESTRLWAECNEHRTARGFAPLPLELDKRG